MNSVIKILIIKLASAGDVLRTTALLSGLKEKYPNSHITWITERPGKGLLEGNANIGRILVYGDKSVSSLKQERFDIIVSLDKDAKATSLAMFIKASEKYGYGLDVFVLAKMYDSAVVIVDDRRTVLDKAQKIISGLKYKNLLNPGKVEFMAINSWEEFEPKEEFDIAVSSGVIQKMNNSLRTNYINKLLDCASHVFILAPNGGNCNHSRITRLQAICMEDIMNWPAYLNTAAKYKKLGLIDMPPFPPGIKNDLRAVKYNGCIIGAVCKILRLWRYIEKFLPRLFKAKFSHTVFCVLSNKV